MLSARCGAAGNEHGQQKKRNDALTYAIKKLLR
jgi:hypothetical protein